MNTPADLREHFRRRCREVHSPFRLRERVLLLFAAGRLRCISSAARIRLSAAPACATVHVPSSQCGRDHRPCTPDTAFHTDCLNRACADPVRLKILSLLSAQPLCVCVIKEVIGIADSKLSYHLNVLRKAGLIDGEPQGNWIIYSLTDGKDALKAFDRASPGVRMIIMVWMDWNLR